MGWLRSKQEITIKRDLIANEWTIIVNDRYCIGSTLRKAIDLAMTHEARDLSARLEKEAEMADAAMAAEARGQRADPQQPV